MYIHIIEQMRDNIMSELHPEINAPAAKALTMSGVLYVTCIVHVHVSYMYFWSLQYFRCRRQPAIEIRCHLFSWYNKDSILIKWSRENGFGQHIDLVFLLHRFFFFFGLMSVRYIREYVIGGQ